MILITRNRFLLYFILHHIRCLPKKSSISSSYLNNSQFLLEADYYYRPKYMRIIYNNSFQVCFSAYTYITALQKT